MSKKGGTSGNQTVTQQNIPDWALDYAQNTMDMTKYYTNNQNYRPSTLDRDYSGIRGYNAQGQPNSQVGQFGLNPSPPQPALEEVTTTPASSGGMVGGGPMRGMGVGFGVGAFDDVFRQYSQGFVDDRKSRTSRGGESESTAFSVDLDGDGKGAFDNSEHNTNTTPSDEKLEEKQNQQNSGNTQAQGMSQEDVQGLIDSSLQQFDENTITPDEMPTPFQSYDRQRFAAPSDRTTQGEGLLADRINEANPYQQAQDVTGRVANYQSGYNPAELNLTGPQANSYNNVLSGFGNVNQGLRSVGYGNANQGLMGANDYTTGRSFQDRVQDFMNPYTDQVVNSSLRDINRARQMADLSTMGGAAKSGAFGGSREALMRAENTRNALDQAAKTSGQLRSAGFNTAANLAQQEELQRLGLTASDRQNLRGYQSAGNLQGQSLTAADLQNVRGLQSQGALAAQGLQAQGALTAQGLGAQSDRDVMNYQQQLQRQGNQIAADQARLAEQFRQGAGALNLQGAGALGNLTKMGVDDRRQRIADLLASGGAQDARNQQDLDFIYNEFQRELAYPGQQIDLRNAAISPATGSIVTTTQPRYSSGGLPQAAGAGLATYGMLAGIPAAAPYALPAALAMGLLNY